MPIKVLYWATPLLAFNYLCPVPSNRILIITYYWPPSGGPAVQRWLSYSRLLADAGFEVYVLSVDEKYAQFPGMDESLNAKVDKRVKVFKTRTRELFWLYKKTVGRGNVPSAAFANESNPGPLKRIARFVRGNFFIPDARKSWNKYALPKALELIETYKIDTVITAGPPHSSHLMGLKLKEKTGSRWVADFHDAWTDIIFYKQLYHTKIAARIDASLERRVLEQADMVLTVGEQYKQRLCSKSTLIDPEKFHILRMGYDDESFDLKSDFTQSIGQQINIVYTGTISDNYHPEVLLDAVSEIRQERSDIHFKFTFAGILSENIEVYFHAKGLADWLDKRGYVSHSESLRLLQQADILLLVNPEVAQEDMVIPGKIYEYLAAQKPILNICSPSAETAAIIDQCGCGVTFGRNQKDELKQWLLNIAQGKLAFNPDLDEIRKFGKQQQAASLAERLRK